MGSTFLLVGASRGLGWATAQRLGLSGEHNGILLSRKAPQGELPNGFRWLRWDAATESAAQELLEIQESLRAQRLIYFVGGGPYGLFQKKEWKDHEWSLKVSFQTPAQFLHQAMRASQGLQQITFIGSAIAGDRPDPEAATYCAAKHALQGLVTSIQKEQSTLDLRLYSPGYLNTGLLPKNAWPRHEGNLLEPELVAQDLLDWLEDVSQVRCHRRYI